MRVILMAGLLLGSLRQVPANLPPAHEVTDPARPDFGYMQPWAGSELTVAIVMGADCERCLDSMAFYKKLSLLSSIDGRARRVVLLADGGIAPVSHAVRQHPHAFKPSKTLSYPADDRFKLRELPALFIIDGQWKRRGEWQGALTAEDEAAILKVIEQIDAEARRGRR
jgi:hypothetical protein